MPATARSEEQSRLLRDFGYRLHAKRTERGLTQMQLAERAGLHYTYVGQMENGRRNVALLNLYALAKALNCHVSELLLDQP